MASPNPTLTSASSSPMDKTFSMRIVCMDYYMAAPIPDMDACYNSLHGQSISEVPVIRIYGPTLSGQKACLHIHGCFPYFYVPYERDLPQNLQEGYNFIRCLATAIEKAMKLNNGVSAKRQHVHSCTLVRAKQFYGYHSSEQLFIKIVLYYPHEVNRVAALLLGGGLLNRVFQPYESHIPYLLQFMIDHNLHGMGHLHLCKLKFRNPLPDEILDKHSLFRNAVFKITHCPEHKSPGKMDCTQKLPFFGKEFWLKSSIPADWVWSFTIPDHIADSPQTSILLQRHSTCELEGDAIVQEILNQQHLMYNSLSQAGAELKMVQSLTPIYEELISMSVPPVKQENIGNPKPPAATVLKSLLREQEYSSMYSRLFPICENNENESSSELPDRREDQMQNHDDNVEAFVHSHHADSSLCKGLEHAHTELLNFTQAANVKDGTSCEVPASQEMHVVEAHDQNSVEALFDEDVIRSQMRKHIDRKDSEKDLVELLRWLASSEAADELCMGDGEGEEMLSQLVTNSIERALEKAQLDYEDASQKECEDILNSAMDFDEPDGKDEIRGEDQSGEGIVSEPSDQTSQSKHFIPQLDGGWDEVNIHSESTSTERKKKSRTATKSASSSSKDESLRAQALWGSLPLKEDVMTSGKDRLASSLENPTEHRPVTDLMKRKHTQIPEILVSTCNVNVESARKNFHCQNNGLQHVGGTEKGFGITDLDMVNQTFELKKCSKKLKHEHGNKTISRYGALPLAKEKEVNSPVESSGEQCGADFQRKTNNEDCHLYPAPQLPSAVEIADMDQEKQKYPSSCKNHEDNVVGVCNYAIDGNEAFDAVGRKYQALPLEKDGSGHFTMITNDTLGNQKLNVSPTLQLHGLANETVECFSNNSNYRQKSSNITEIACEVIENCNPQQLITGNDPIIGNQSGQNKTRHLFDFTEEKLQASKKHLGNAVESMTLTAHSLDNYSKAELTVCSFAMKPPSREQIQASLENFSLPPVDHGEPFHRHVGVSSMTWNDECPLSVDKSIDVKQLCPFFPDSTKEKSLHASVYVNSEFWDSCCGSNARVGFRTEYQNDGSVLYLLTPSIPPPLLSDVENWLSRNEKKKATNVLQAKVDVAEHGGDHAQTESESSELHAVANTSDTSMRSQILCRDSDGKSPTVKVFHELLRNEQDVSQISAPLQSGAKLTPLSQTGFRDPASVGAGQKITLMSIEIHAESRGELRPDPRYDAVNFIATVMQEDSSDLSETVIIIKDENSHLYKRNVDGLCGSQVLYVNHEITLFNLFIEMVLVFDPDILMGWEIQGESIGFLAERAAFLGIGLLKKISRTPFETKQSAIHLDNRKNESVDQVSGEFVGDVTDLIDTIIEDEWGRTHGSGIHVGGRIVLNLWRIMRGELTLRIYTLEAVVESVLRRKIPVIPWRTLSAWFKSSGGRNRHLCIRYFAEKTKLNLDIMFQLDMINRTSELARVFGIDFFSVLSRGSQYRVESMMLRLAHTQNFLAVSPSRPQVASQPAMECLPLVMEPESKLYTDPVVVLDFQSLYPSMIIAYNLCFSTCLGKACSGKMVLGVTSYKCDSQLLSNIKENLFMTPNGIMYVSPELRPGVLPRLLDEILSTRIMVKNAMKKLKSDQRVLQRVLNSRQLALKLIANVTYGYTAAGFSGRMPCAELADSIVQCGRRTLENTISFVNSNDKWNARVVYGDTDSMFVLLKGRTREEAFKIGQEIASAVTARNPYPVTLKMEKVYHPCVLITKKRYVGYSYEHPAQEKPVFDAKGIETIRRDGCLAVAKIMERSLRILFESKDLSQVKMYLYRQWQKILSGRISLQDFIFAKEVRLGTYSMNAHSLPPAAIVATKAMKCDPRAEPRYGERIRYVVVHGEPGARLVDMVVDPLELLKLHAPHRLHDTYYITKQIIPALQRVFILVGVDIKKWFSEMPRQIRPMLAKRHPNFLTAEVGWSGHGSHGRKVQKASMKSTIDRYYLSQHCAVCGELIRSSSYTCDECSKNQCLVAMALTGRASKLERELEHLNAICRHCGGGNGVVEKEITCISLDCVVFFERMKVQKEFLAVSEVSAASGFYPNCTLELF